MISILKDKIREMPKVYDFCIRIKRRFGIKTPSYDALLKLSDKFTGNVKFIQIGANDGLRNDPIREFIVNNNWSGILIEPVPVVFEELKNNYSMVEDGRLNFVNAAISDRNNDSLSFWTFNDAFMDNLSKEERLDRLRKSSFDKNHLISFYGNHKDLDKIIHEIKVPAYTLKEVINKAWSNRGDINLLVIDAEGHEPTIIKSIDYTDLRPNAIFFESHHLLEQRRVIFDILINNGYKLFTFAGDTMAYDARCEKLLPLYSENLIENAT